MFWTLFKITPEHNFIPPDLCFPVCLVPALCAAMQSVLPVVDGQVVSDPAQAELPAPDPVGHSAHSGPKVRVVRALVLLDGVVAQYDVLAVWEQEPGDGGAPADHGEGEASGVGQPQPPHTAPLLVSPGLQLLHQSVRVSVTGARNLDVNLILKTLLS